MLVITRQTTEAFSIDAFDASGNSVEIVISIRDIQRGKAVIGINAPTSIRVRRDNIKHLGKIGRIEGQSAFS